jgi:uncharacterized protein
MGKTDYTKSWMYCEQNNGWKTIMKQIWIIGLLILLLCATTGVLAQEYPTLNGYVTDNAGILTYDEKAALTSRIVQIENSTSVEIAILDVQTTNGESLADYATKVGNKNGVGKKATDNGILILVSFENERGIFIATGKGTEGVITDAQASRIYQSGKPYFTNKQYAAGYNVMLDGIQAILLHDDSAQTNTTENGNDVFGGMSFFTILVIFLIVLIGLFVLVALFGGGGSGGFGGGGYGGFGGSGGSGGDSGGSSGGFGGGGFGGGGSGGSF